MEGLQFEWILGQGAKMMESHRIVEQIVIVLSGVDLARRAVFDNPEADETARKEIAEIAFKVRKAVGEHLGDFDIPTVILGVWAYLGALCEETFKLAEKMLKTDSSNGCD